MKNKLLKYIGLAVASLLVPFCSSCSGNNTDGKVSIITTIFPEYDWVMNVLGEKKDSMNVKLLLDNGADLHNYDPSPIDIVNISKCDLFIYVGGESDDWVNDVLAQAKNKNMLTINLLETLGDAAKTEEIVEGMQNGEHDHDGDHDHDHEEEEEYDEHVWLSLRNSQVFVDKIRESISTLDQANADYYKANADAYIANLKRLDDLYGQAVKDGNRDTILFADRFPFRYLTDDYSLTYYAAFTGCSAETEVTSETIRFLVNKVDELQLKVILVIEGSNGKIAQTVKNESKSKDQKILKMDSIQSASTKEYANGRNYLSTMESNLDVLKEALK